MKAVVAAFNQEKALVGAFSVITNLRMELFEALPVRARDKGGGLGRVLLSVLPALLLHLPRLPSQILLVVLQPEHIAVIIHIMVISAVNCTSEQLFSLFILSQSPMESGSNKLHYTVGTIL